ncbi:ATP-binding cassette domain-containing protein [Ornithinibacillus halophilus]|uniref:ABC-2 type transport system ATP-binding protein n=1 Tax=Ornithinibacillus halophilus TaxID=930117 RepID=A0A1M5HK86_9BACI|nr:ATP-binding cassette domain-containing protein [Ornithinibacillus halophilus]SHG16355.1 ABC-2 type transport system ATP-binding protein [Ornithinibacillus halophilus]
MLKCVNFSKSYGKEAIIQSSSFELRENKISFLMGPNGSGKTTLIKCMMGMEKYDGQFQFNGQAMNQVKDQCLVLWDDCPFYTNLSGIKNLYIFSENKKTKKQIDKIAVKYLEHGILKNKVSTYSYGQKKKLALILVEILEPELLIMDEISNGLDYEMIRRLQDIIKGWSEKMTILLTGHQFSFYNDIVDDLLVFKDKEIVVLQEDFIESGKELGDIYDKEIL